MRAAHHLKRLLVVIATAVAVASPQTTTNHKEPKKPDTENNQQMVNAVYRQVSAEDRIRFYSESSTIELLPDPDAKPLQASLHEEGFECGVIGDNGKKVEIVLVSTTVDHGQIKTRDFGILKLQPAAQGMAIKLFATETQIKKLRALQSSGQPQASAR